MDDRAGFLLPCALKVQSMITTAFKRLPKGMAGTLILLLQKTHILYSCTDLSRHISEHSKLMKVIHIKN